MTKRGPISEEERKKREEALIARFGSAQNLKQKRREWQAKSRENYTGNGGFRAHSVERRKEISRLGVEARKKKS